MKIAVLILVHEWKDQQKELVTYLSKSFEVFIHVDKRSQIKLKEVSISGVEVISLYRVFWGHYNQIRATLALFNIARSRGFDRYILISGQDLPLVTSNVISDFFSYNKKEYFEFFKLPYCGWGDNGGLDRVEYYHPKYLTRGRSSLLSKKINRLAHFLSRDFIKPIMNVFGKRSLDGLELWGGSNWMNLTSDCVKQMLDWIQDNPWYLKRFRFTRCADEIFFHTVILEKCKGLEIVNDNLRYIDWETGPEAPRILRVEDLDKMFRSQKLFARKFDSSVDNAVVNKVLENLTSRST